MIPRECKRLAEVDFPIAEVSKHAAREKSIRHGHPSTLHLWWARRPLASSRAVLLALLLPDPCDVHCPEGFKRQAREILRAVRQPPANDVELRQGLLAFIANFANWKNAADRTHLDVSRALVKAAHGEGAAAGGGSVCGRGVDSVGGVAAGLRGVCQRFESGGVSDSQGDAGGYSAAWAGVG